MGNLQSNLAHIVVTLAVIAAVATLAAVGVLPGETALLVIAGVGGVSVGGGVASSAASSPAPGVTTVNVPAHSGSKSNGVTITPTSDQTSAPALWTSSRRSLEFRPDQGEGLAQQKDNQEDLGGSPPSMV